MPGPADLRPAACLLDSTAGTARLRQIRREILDVLRRCRPGTHQPTDIRLKEFVELPPPPPEPLRDVVRQMNEERVRLARKSQRQTRGAQFFFQSARHFVGVPGVL